MLVLYGTFNAVGKCIEFRSNTNAFVETFSVDEIPEISETSRKIFNRLRLEYPSSMLKRKSVQQLSNEPEAYKGSSVTIVIAVIICIIVASIFPPAGAVLFTVGAICALIILIGLTFSKKPSSEATDERNDRLVSYLNKSFEFYLNKYETVFDRVHIKINIESDVGKRDALLKALTELLEGRAFYLRFAL